jgi:hypothetical protein
MNIAIQLRFHNIISKHVRHWKALKGTDEQRAEAEQRRFVGGMKKIFEEYREKWRLNWHDLKVNKMVEEFIENQGTTYSLRVRCHSPSYEVYVEPTHQKKIGI